MNRLQNRSMVLLGVFISLAMIAGVSNVAIAQPHGGGGFTRVNTPTSYNFSTCSYISRMRFVAWR